MSASDHRARRGVKRLLLSGLVGAVAVLAAPGGATGALPACGGAATKDWVGPAAGGSWQTGANWDGGTVPGAGDEVCVAGTGTVTHLGASTTIASLQTTGMGLTLGSGTLAITAGPDPSTIRGPLLISAGTLTLDGGGNLDGLTQSGGALSGVGEVTLDGPGPFTWNAGDWTGTAQVVVPTGRALTITSNSVKNLNRPLVNHGTTTITSALPMSSAGSITNGTTGNPGTLNLSNDNSIGGPGSTITNSPASTITKTTGAGTTTLNSALTNNGTLDIQTGTLSLTGTLTNFSGTTLAGGTYRVAGVLRFPSANVVTDAAQIVLDAPGAAVQDLSGLNGLRNLATVTTAGSLTVRNGATATSTAPLANAGAVTVGSGSSLTTGGSVANSGTLEGSGLLVAGASGTLTNTGTVRPGTGAGGIGTLAVTGGYQQTGAGTLEVDIAGETPGVTQDRLTVSGAATLAGTLAIVTAPAYTPAVPTTHTIVAAGTLTGTFAPVTGRVGTLGGRYTVQYTPTSVVLQFAPPTITVDVPSTLDLGVLPVGGTATGSITATVENTYRAGYGLSVSRTAFPTGIPLTMELLTAPPGAEIFGVTAGAGFAIPVNPAPDQSIGRRLGGPSPDESGLTPEGVGDAWQVTVNGGPVGWTQAGTHTTVVTFTAVTL